MLENCLNPVVLSECDRQRQRSCQDYTTKVSVSKLSEPC